MCIRDRVKYLFCCTFTLCGLMWLLCLLWPGLFAAVFSATEEVTAVVTAYMPFFMGGCIFFSAQSAFQNTFLALGQARISIFLALLRKVILLDVYKRQVLKFGVFKGGGQPAAELCPGD